MTKDSLVYVGHMLECIETIKAYLKGVNKDRFYDDPLLKDAVVRRLEIIGEAARDMSPAFKNKHPDIEWRDIVDLRNVLIHEYEDVNFDIIWKIATKDTARLKKQLLKIKKDLKKS